MDQVVIELAKSIMLSVAMSIGVAGLLFFLAPYIYGRVKKFISPETLAMISNALEAVSTLKEKFSPAVEGKEDKFGNILHWAEIAVSYADQAVKIEDNPDKEKSNAKKKELAMKYVCELYEEVFNIEVDDKIKRIIDGTIEAVYHMLKKTKTENSTPK